MKKRSIVRVLGLGLLALVSACGLASCGKKDTVFNIQCWNDEFRVFFNRYASDEGKELIKEGKLMEQKSAQAKTGLHYKGVPVVWTETPNSDGQYQAAVDLALQNQATNPDNKKVDMFLAEADYILKYADSSATQDITTLGTNVDLTNTYGYTVDAASDKNGKVKGVSFQCCPSGLIYNRTIAKAVWGTDDPTEIQKKVSTWEKFAEAAAEVKAKGYLMTASEADSYRVFSNNASSAWVDSTGKLTIPQVVYTWMDQADSFVANGYTQTSDVWGAKKTFSIADRSSFSQILADKKDDAEFTAVDTATVKEAFCTFGPAWYYNFCMGYSKKGDWGLCVGPQAHFWGGTWIMAATGTDNPDLVASVMNDFINDETICKALVKNEGQFTNNKKVNAEAAKTASNEFLGGQNDTAIWVSMADSIKFKNATVYDQLCNEGFQKYYREYLEGATGVDTRQKAIDNFYTYIKTKYATLKTA